MDKANTLQQWWAVRGEEGAHMLPSSIDFFIYLVLAWNLFLFYGVLEALWWQRTIRITFHRNWADTISEMGTVWRSQYHPSAQPIESSEKPAALRYMQCQGISTNKSNDWHCGIKWNLTICILFQWIKLISNTSSWNSFFFSL